MSTSGPGQGGWLLFLEKLFTLIWTTFIRKDTV